MSSSPAIDTARHVYQLKSWQKMLYLIAGMLFVTFGAVFGPILFSAASNGIPGVLVAFFFLGFGVYMLAQAFRAQLVIEGSRIEVRSAFRERSADLADIEGFRTISSRNGTYTQLQLKAGLGSISISNSFDTDDDYRTWFKQATDLDQRDREQILNEISQEVELGSTPQERLDALATAKTWAVFISIVTGVAAAALAFGPPPVQFIAAVLVALAPLTALFLMQRSPLLYAMFKQKADPRGELSFVLILAAFGLLIHCGGLHFVSMQPLLYFIVPIGLIYVAVYYSISNKGSSRPGTIIAVLFFAGMYSYSLGMVADTLTDHATATVYSAQVLDKHLSRGRSTTYYLNLAPWGPIENPGQVSVPMRTYDTVEPGDQVCLRLHPGSLHVPWYQLADCSAQYGPANSP